MTPPLKQRKARFTTGLPAILNYRGREYPGIGENLSREGMLLVGHLPWPEDSRVRVTLRTPDGRLAVDVDCRVAQVVENAEEGQVRLGLEFRELAPEVARDLDALVARIVEGVGANPLDLLPVRAKPSEVIRALERMPIAHRVSLAKRASPAQRDLLRLDPKPQVLEALARNPHLTPSEAKKLARLQQLLPSTLAVLAADPRWADDDELKVLVATHPRVPIQVAEDVVRELGPMAVRRVLMSPGLNPVTRQKLMASTTQRGNRGS